MPADRHALAAFLVAHGAADSTVAAWLDAPMLATLDAAPAGDRFPLVLLAQGNGQTTPDQAPLGEYLASHGYFVATSPSPTRISGPLEDEASVGARSEDQALDLAFVGTALAGRPDVAQGRIGLVAHSFGARGALLFSMRDSTVAALVSLDGGIGTATARACYERAPSFDPTTTRTPMLHVYERLDAFMAPDFGLRPRADHHLFTDLGAAALGYLSLRPALGASPETARAYPSVARATLDFLDAFLNRDPATRRRFEHGGWPGLGRLERLQ